jgi:NitT/TauT family transport system ATP-binding protein
MFASAKLAAWVSNPPSRTPLRAVTGRAGTSVSLEAVELAVGEQLILETTSLRIHAGEFVCLLGPSGCGKSTLLNLIAGLVAPTKGQLLSNERPIVAPSPKRTMVFQDAALFPWLTLRANIEYPLQLQNVPKGERQARSEELLRLVHLWRFAGHYPHELSGGMRQRGAIARALATDPEVLLMDEPFAALDAQTREILHAEVERIHERSRKTFVFVTHNVREAVRLADRVVLMGARPGRVLHEAIIDLPRPRPTNDPRMSSLAREIARHIASEVEKVAREEADDAWVAPADGVRVDPHWNLGGGF